MLRAVLLTLLCLILLSCGGGSGSGGSDPVVDHQTNLSSVSVSTALASRAVEDQCEGSNLGPPVSVGSLDTMGINFPALVRTIEDPARVLMFTGGFSHFASAAMLASTPAGDLDHIRFSRAQEEIWVAELDDQLTGWRETRRYAIGIQPDTPVQRWNGLPYDQVYSMGFSSICFKHFQDGQCNVQIDDASVITYEIDGLNQYLLYFTMFENYRWHSPLLGELHAEGPSEPRTQNIQNIGLAISTDGNTWLFVDKVLGDAEIDTDGEVILGAWSPSVILNPNTGLVDVYFHDALGTKQYVAHFYKGSDLLSIDRLNRNDETYRTNLDVIYRNSRYEVMYNDGDYAIARTSFSVQESFGVECGSKIVVPASSAEMFPTPHQFMNDDGKLLMYYWNFFNDDQIIVNTYDVGKP